MKHITDTPRVYIADLAAYNSGSLHGKWIDATDYEELQESISDIMKTSPEPYAEEWAIHDYEGFGDYRVSEWEDLQELCDLGAALELADAREYAAINYLLSDKGCSISETLDRYEDVSIFEGTALDYAYEYVGDCYDLPEIAQQYFDYEMFARDLRLGGDVDEITIDGTDYVVTNASEF